MKVLSAALIIVIIEETLKKIIAPTKCNYCLSKTCTPTIVAAENFNLMKDIQLLKDSLIFKILGSAEDTLINILTARSEEQRMLLSEDYIKSGSTLIDGISKDSNAKYLGVLEALMKPLPLFYAEELRDALNANNNEALVEILTSLPSCAIREISTLYRIMYRVSLYDDIASHTWHNFKQFLLELAKGDREEDETVNIQRAEKDASSLISSGVDGNVLRVRTFNEIFTKRSFPQLRATFEKYDEFRKEKDAKYESLTKDITDLFNDKLEIGYLALVRNVLDQPQYFARQLKIALTAFVMELESKTVIRIIRGRSELDLKEIKEAYANMYSKSLTYLIKENTYSIYDKSLLAVLKEQL